MKVNVYQVLNFEVTMRAASSCYYIVPYDQFASISFSVICYSFRLDIQTFNFFLVLRSTAVLEENVLTIFFAIFKECSLVTFRIWRTHPSLVPMLVFCKYTANSCFKDTAHQVNFSDKLFIWNVLCQWSPNYSLISGNDETFFLKL